MSLLRVGCLSLLAGLAAAQLSPHAGDVWGSPTTEYCYHTEDPASHKCYEGCATRDFKNRGLSQPGVCNPQLFNKVTSTKNIRQCSDGLTNVKYCTAPLYQLTVTAKTRGQDPDATTPVRSVVILRHCLRSTPTSAYGAKGFNDLNNYSSTAFPGWPVADYQCLPEGDRLIGRMGAQLGPSLPMPLDIRVDTSATRDNDTATNFLRGMGHPLAYTSAPALFDPVAAGFCPKMSSANESAALRARIANFPRPADHIARLQAMQAVLGKGAAPSIDTIKDTVGGAYYSGGSSVAAGFAEAFLMQMGAKMPVAWGRATPAQVYDFLETHIYIRGVQNRALPLVSYSHTYMVHEIMSHLQSTANGTLMLVGHDGDLDALATLFGLSWHSAPFPPNATTPGSGIRFDVASDGSISATLVYQDFQASAPDEMHTSPTAWSWTSASRVTLNDLDSWLGPRLDETCVPKL